MDNSWWETRSVGRTARGRPRKGRHDPASLQTLAQPSVVRAVKQQRWKVLFSKLQYLPDEELVVTRGLVRNAAALQHGATARQHRRAVFTQRPFAFVKAVLLGSCKPAREMQLRLSQHIHRKTIRSLKGRAMGAGLTQRPQHQWRVE